MNSFVISKTIYHNSQGKNILDYLKNFQIQLESVVERVSLIENNFKKQEKAKTFSNVILSSEILGTQKPNTAAKDQVIESVESKKPLGNTPSKLDINRQFFVPRGLPKFRSISKSDLSIEDPQDFIDQFVVVCRANYF